MNDGAVSEGSAERSKPLPKLKQNPSNYALPCSIRDDSAEGLSTSMAEALEPMEPSDSSLLLLPPVSPQQQQQAASSGKFGRRPDTRERSNGRVALTVLKPKSLEVLGEEVAEAEAETALREESSRRGGDASAPASPHKGASKGAAKKGGATVPLKVGLCLSAYQPLSLCSLYVSLCLCLMPHSAASGPPRNPTRLPSGVPGSQAAEAGDLVRGSHRPRRRPDAAQALHL